MSIKENQLPTAQEVTENNLIRTVDENGASQNMTVEQLGGLVGGDSGEDSEIFNINVYEDEGEFYADKTPEEIVNAYNNGKTLLVNHAATLCMMVPTSNYYQFGFANIGFLTRSDQITEIVAINYWYSNGFWIRADKTIAQFI